jgi:hypothetical protein
MTTNTEALNICLARRLAIADKRPLQAAIVQTAARMMTQTQDQQTKLACLDLIAATPAERQRIVELEQKNDELLEQVEQLRAAAEQLLNADDGEDRAAIHDKLNELILKTPEQCLAERDADAMEAAGKYLLSLITAPPGLLFTSADALYKRANKLRQAAKKGSDV